MGFWLVCQLPQFIKNCRRRSVEALSFCFLMEWLGGDILNFAGSLLSGVLPTQIWLAGWFVVMDAFILTQYTWLYCLNRNKPKQVVHSDSEDDEHPRDKAANPGDDDDLEDDGGLEYRTDQAPRGGEPYMPLSRDDKAATTTVTASTRQSLNHPQALSVEDGEASPASKRGTLTPLRGPAASSAVDDADITHMSTSIGHGRGKPTMELPRMTRGGPSSSLGAAVEASDATDQPAPGVVLLSQPMASRRPASNGSSSAAGTATCDRTSRLPLALASVACFAVCVGIPAAHRWEDLKRAMRGEASSSATVSASWPLAHGASQQRRLSVEFATADAPLFHSGLPLYNEQEQGLERAPRRLEIHSCVPIHNETQAQKNLDVVGDVMGWISSALYVTSRLPQVYKNWSRGTVEGLSWLMFFCAFMGNATALMGIFPRMSSTADWVAEAPFLPGTAGTLGLDITIICQYFYYTNRAKRRREARKEARGAAKRAAGGKGLLGKDSATRGADPTTSLLLDTPDLISADARRGLFDMVESPPPSRSVPTPHTASYMATQNSRVK
jgi:solute carrier family 66 (lysosomal lysine-arginine transporter), member 1